MSTLRAYLQLCRFPAVFTALADIVLGYLLTRTQVDSVPQLGLLLGASAGLYLSGMVWNDIFDRQQDAAERPKRPIPSGRVSLRAAILSTDLARANEVGEKMSIPMSLLGVIFMAILVAPALLRVTAGG